MFEKKVVEFLDMNNAVKDVTKLHTIARNGLYFFPFTLKLSWITYLKFRIIVWKYESSKSVISICF
jgi:hypothetical protein